MVHGGGAAFLLLRQVEERRREAESVGVPSLRSSTHQGYIYSSVVYEGPTSQSIPITPREAERNCGCGAKDWTHFPGGIRCAYCHGSPR